MGKNDKLLIVERKNKENNEELENLIRAFKEELRPIAAESKDWPKANI